ncbi:g12199 [Coccomyxa viridis]|uniref:G12199 protein n=1 Tax=Coccomyxa viridis TaxID=1274662 RepID=A0ABP1G9R1_9CHLO
MLQQSREDETVVLAEQASQTGRGGLNKAMPARLVYRAASENQVLGRRETIIRVTKDHEVVDVDGFVFKRKRRMPLSENANVPDEQAKRFKICDTDKAWNQLQIRNQDDGNSSPSQRAGDRGDRHIVGEAANHGGAAVTASIAQAALESLPFEGASEGSRLMALCQRCIEDVVAGAEELSGAEQLQDMLAAFLSAVEASLEDGTLQAADAAPTSNAALEEQRVLLAQLQSEQDVLQSRLQAFEQEEQDWLQLMKETENTAEEASPGAAAGDDDVVEPAGFDSAVTESLRQAHVSTHRTLTFQVDGLCAMVEGVQDLVARAEQISAKEFDVLFKKNFSALPGLSSPARLIREMVKPDIADAGVSTGC